MRPQVSTVDSEIGVIAGRQHGLITSGQLRGTGLTGAAIQRRVRTGRLLREHRGVYRVGHRAPSLEARYLAAVLACGEGALLSGEAAGHLHRLLRGLAPPPEVTAPTDRRVPGVRARRGRRPKGEAVVIRGIPVTSVPRTLVDLAGVLSEGGLARACHEAEVRYRLKPNQVDAVLARRPTTPGAAKLRRVLHGDTPVTLSKLESRFLALLRAEGLPLPHTNKPAGGRYVDCRWPEHKLTVELDSYRFHSSRFSWEQDRRREREAYARGDDLRRYTYGDVFEDSRDMMAELHTVLGA